MTKMSNCVVQVVHIVPYTVRSGPQVLIKSFPLHNHLVEVHDGWSDKFGLGRCALAARRCSDHNVSWQQASRVRPFHAARCPMLACSTSHNASAARCIAERECGALPVMEHECPHRLQPGECRTTTSRFSDERADRLTRSKWELSERSCRGRRCAGGGGRSDGQTRDAARVGT